jgi:hypothetical protein
MSKPDQNQMDLGTFFQKHVYDFLQSCGFKSKIQLDSYHKQLTTYSNQKDNPLFYISKLILEQDWWKQLLSPDVEDSILALPGEDFNLLFFPHLFSNPHQFTMMYLPFQTGSSPIHVSPALKSASGKVTIVTQDNQLSLESFKDCVLESVLIKLVKDCFSVTLRPSYPSLFLIVDNDSVSNPSVFRIQWDWSLCEVQQLGHKIKAPALLDSSWKDKNSSTQILNQLPSEKFVFTGLPSLRFLPENELFFSNKLQFICSQPWRKIIHNVSSLQNCLKQILPGKPNLNIHWYTIWRGNLFEVKPKNQESYELEMEVKATNSTQWSAWAEIRALGSRWQWVDLAHSDLVRSLEPTTVGSLTYSANGLTVFVTFTENSTWLNDHMEGLHSQGFELGLVQVLTSFWNHLNQDLHRETINEFTSLHPSIMAKMEQQIWENKVHTSISQARVETPGSIHISDAGFLIGVSGIKNLHGLLYQACLLDFKTHLKNILKSAELLQSEVKSIDSISLLKYRAQRFLDKLNQEFGLELEGEIVQFIKEFATPQILNFSNRYQLLKKCYSDIFIKENLIDGIWHEERNKVLSAKNHLIQTWQNHHTKDQEFLQAIMPHYVSSDFTNGLEQTLYFSPELSGAVVYTESHVQNIRLWQLKNIIRNEISKPHDSEEYKIRFDIYHTILAVDDLVDLEYRSKTHHLHVIHHPLAANDSLTQELAKIRRGGTSERASISNHICVFVNSVRLKKLYLDFFEYLASDHLLDPVPEVFGVENLLGVRDLVCLRAKITQQDKSNSRDPVAKSA